jgi:hypothetical protein
MLTAVDASPTSKDVVLAVIGASAALAGLVLVFVGILVTAYQGLIGKEGISDKTLDRFEGAAWVSFAVFCLALLSLALGVVWLDWDGGQTFYKVVVAIFFVEVVALGLAAFYVTSRVLLRS